MKFSPDFVERCVETFQDRDDLVKLLEAGGPVTAILRILDEECRKAAMSIPAPAPSEGAGSHGSREGALEAQAKFDLVSKFKNMVNRMPS